MNKFSTKIRQKQSIIPKQILQSSFLELGLDDIEKELENEIQKNPVLIEKNIEDSKDKDYERYGLDNQENYDLFLLYPLLYPPLLLFLSKFLLGRST